MMSVDFWLIEISYNAELLARSSYINLKTVSFFISHRNVKNWLICKWYTKTNIKTLEFHLETPNKQTLKKKSMTSAK